MELKEQEKDVNDLYYYINLLLITEYLYNNSLYNDKLNKFKNTKNNNILSKIKKFLSITNNKNRDITYIWYSKIKEDNKIDFIKYYSIIIIFIYINILINLSKINISELIK